MKRLLIALVLVLGLFVTQTEANAKISVGGGLAYGTGVDGIDGSIGLDLRGVYDIDDRFRGVANFQYFFVEDPLALYTIDLNGNYIFSNNKTTMFYGIFGLDIATVSVSFDLGPFGGSSSVSSTEIGLNLGAGVDHNIGNVALFGEVKYVVGSADQLVICAGVRVPID